MLLHEKHVKTAMLSRMQARTEAHFREVMDNGIRVNPCCQAAASAMGSLASSSTHIELDAMHNKETTKEHGQSLSELDITDSQAMDALDLLAQASESEISNLMESQIEGTAHGIW